nr:TonB-dependent siderophore receptor [Curvibacter gracilis]
MTPCPLPAHRRRSTFGSTLRSSLRSCTPPQPRLRAVTQAALTLCSLALPGLLQAQGTTPAEAQSEKALPSITIQARPEAETATTPVTGFVARQSASATKTDTPVLETPQAISVVTRDQIEAQGATTLRQTTAYSAGIVSSYFDSRVDSFKARGGDVTQYLDGLLRSYGTYNTTRPDPYTLERVELLRGPSSVLYGQGQIGGVLNLSSKRPQAETQREIQLQLGSYQRRQIAADLTGPLDAEGQWLYRLILVGRDSGTQVDHVADDRTVVAPTLTWRPNADTSLTVQGLYQRDQSGSLIGFFPWQGTLRPSAYGQIPTNTFIGEPGWDAYNTRQSSLGYLFSHRLNEHWTLRQNLRATESEVDYRTAYTSFTANAATGRPARPVFNADNRTLARDLVQQLNTGRMVLLDNQAERSWQSGAVSHRLLLGLDLQRNQTGQWTGSGKAGDIDVYQPVYGNYTPPARLTRQPSVTQRQLGLYTQDQIAWERWRLTLGLRHDSAQTDTEGRPAAAIDDKAWSKRAGLSYLADGGWAPYLSYSESFLPLGGVNAYGSAYKPQRGKQWEAGVKWQPPGRGITAYAAVYDLRDTNRKTSDPANPLNSLQIGEARVRGAELEVTASLNRHWDWTGSYAWTDARVSRSTGADQGKRLSGVPQHSAALWLMHRFAGQGRGGLSAGMGLRYLGESWDGTDSLRTPSSTLLDAMVAYDQGHWRLALNAVNLADKVQITTCLTRGDCFYGQRRTVVATATYRF